MSKPTLLVVILILAVPSLANAEFVTLGINTLATNGPVVLTNSITINSNQIIQLVSVDRWDPRYYLDIEKSGLTFSFEMNRFAANVGIGSHWRQLTPIAGPATIRVRREAGRQVTTFLTFEITPQAQNPEKSVVVLPTASGAYVRLESSTDLQSWMQATNGVYADTNLARFFRITLDGLAAQPQNGSINFPTGSRVVTIVSTSSSNAVYSISEYETAELVAVSGKEGLYNSQLLGSWEVIRGGIVDVLGPIREFWEDWTPVRGAATFRLTTVNGDKSYGTLRITTEQYPPDKTLITLPGTNTYNVELQGSTNLKDWTTATNGVYTEPSAMFFRIDSQRVD